jgi:ubiquitin carboxyl-terminal hydrolase 22/27/51
MSGRPTTPASPKNVKIKSPVPGTPMFGCGMLGTDRRIFYVQGRGVYGTDCLIEHVQLLFDRGPEVMNSCISHYKMILRGIFDNTPIVPQTSTNPEGRPITTLTSNYLCLQCPSTVTEEDRLKHGNKKSHRFCKSTADEPNRKAVS